MRKARLLILLPVLMISACEKNTLNNPFLTGFNTPFGVPPFDRIREEHYRPAFHEGVERQKAEIDAIANNPAEPTFDNTIAAMDSSGELLTRVSNVFYALTSANTTDTLQAIAKDIAPMLSRHQDDIYLNENLFRRIKVLYGKKRGLGLTAEQQTVLEKYYEDFVKGGANLDPAKKEKFRRINEKLSLLSLKFGENILKEDNAFYLTISDSAELGGLSRDIRTAAAEAARERGEDGSWVFTLHNPSRIPFLQYSDQREYREKLFMAYISRGDYDNELDTKAIADSMVNLRIERANLLGYRSHADYVLEDNMAGKAENVYALLHKVWDPALRKAKSEAKELQAMIDSEGGGFNLEPWDWWYYAEKVKKAKYDLDESELRPYFKLENVINGVFSVAEKLYGIRIEERKDLPKYHPDVKVFEVKEADGTHIGILYADYFPRTSKRGGAWMTAFRKEGRRNGKKITPVICNVGNFTKPTADKPSLLSLDEMNTLFHEFGHALHGLLSDATCQRVSGTSVSRDFVELPSQIMENWGNDPEVMKMYARHYKTGEPIPDELIAKIKKSSYFNQGFATVELLSAAYLDMDWHTLETVQKHDVHKFEDESMQKIGLIPEIVVRYRTTYFKHIFSGGYSAGYYSYIWAEVLDADAFETFKENGLFDRKTAESFRKNILAPGGSEDPMVLYKRFRGHEPDIKPLLVRRGLE
jgi:peptidyl-dipeptidase Dcp